MNLAGGGGGTIIQTIAKSLTRAVQTQVVQGSTVHHFVKFWSSTLNFGSQNLYFPRIFEIWKRREHLKPDLGTKETNYFGSKTNKQQVMEEFLIKVF